MRIYGYNSHTRRCNRKQRRLDTRCELRIARCSRDIFTDVTFFQNDRYILLLMELYAAAKGRTRRRVGHHAVGEAAIGSSRACTAQSDVFGRPSSCTHAGPWLSTRYAWVWSRCRRFPAVSPRLLTVHQVFYLRRGSRGLGRYAEHQHICPTKCWAVL